MYQKITNDISIEDLTEIFYEFSKQRKWEDKYFPNQIAKALIIESAELLEIFQRKDNKESSNLIKNELIKRELSYEIVDILYYLLILARTSEIDLPKAIIEKLQQLEVRYPPSTSIPKSKGQTKNKEKKSLQKLHARSTNQSQPPRKTRKRKNKG